MRAKQPLLIFPAVLLIGFLLIGRSWSGSRADEKQAYTDECLDCHEDRDKTLAGSVHELRIGDKNKAIACSNCHTGAEQHLEDPSAANIFNPAAATGRETAALCRSCHFTDHQQALAGKNIHTENDISCTNCHKVHGNPQLYLLVEPQPELCYRCHQSVRGEFSAVYRHPVPDGILTCTDCHTHLDAVDLSPGLGRLSQVCYKCHQEFQGPFPFEHQALVEYSTEEGSCLNCHSPHGSNLPRMLNQPLEPPNFALCAQCHLVPGHQYNAYHGNQWAGRSCSNCHVDVHGSYVSRKFLKPSLPYEEGLNCFGPGCHQL